MTVRLLVQCAVSFAAVMAFAILFHAPRREWVPCGLTGMVGWVVYWLAVQGGISVVAASFCGTLGLALLSRVLAVVRRCPVTVFLTGGIFPLVPGAGVYWTVYYIVTDELSLAVQNGYMAVKTAVAIVLGIVFVFELPQGLFRFLMGRRR